LRKARHLPEGVETLRPELGWGAEFGRVVP